MSDSYGQLDRDRRIDAICDDFERLLREGGHPNIEDYLRRVSVDERPNLSVELLRVAVEYAGPSLRRPDQINDELVARRGRPSTDHANDPATAIPPTSNPTIASLKRLGDYELIDEIGSGGMGVVYRARDLSVDRIVALKIVRPDRWKGLSVEQRDRAIERFLLESQAAARGNHPNVLTIYHAGQQDGVYYLAMQFVDGGSLAEFVSGGPLEDRRAAAYMEPVCRALFAVHQAGIVHRDLKPSNILVDSGSDRPLVSDFGLAKVYDRGQELTLSGDVFGTPAYISPEQIVNAGQVSSSTDVYGVGATLYHLLTGRPPFQASTVPGVVHQVLCADPVQPRLLNPAVSRDMETIALKCLEKEPQRRYADALAVAKDLQRYLAGQPIEARPIGISGMTYRWCRRHQLTAGLICTLITTAVVALCLISILYMRERRSLAQVNELLSRSYIEKANVALSATTAESLTYLAEALALDQGTDRELASKLRLDCLLQRFPSLVGLYPHESRIVCGTLNESGDRLAIGTAEGQVRYWEIGGQAKPVVWTFGGSISDLSLSPDGKYLTAVSQDGRVHLCSLMDSSATPKLVSEKGKAGGLCFSPNSQLLAVAELDGLVRFWTQSEQAIPRPLAHDSPVLALQFSADSEQLVAGTVEGRVIVSSVKTSERLLSSPKLGAAVCYCAFEPKGKWVLAVKSDGVAERLDLSSQQRQVLCQAQGGSLVTAQIDKLNRCLVATRNGQLRRFDCAEGASQDPAVQIGSEIALAAFSREGNVAAIGKRDQMVTLWSLSTSPRSFATLPISAQLTGLQVGGDALLTIADQVASLWSFMPAESSNSPARSRDVSIALNHNQGFAGVVNRHTPARLTLSEDCPTPIASIDQEAVITALATSENGDSLAWIDQRGRSWLTTSKTSAPQLVGRELARTLALSPVGDALAIAEGMQVRLLDVSADCAQVTSLALGFQPRWVYLSTGGTRLLAGDARQAVLVNTAEHHSRILIHDDVIRIHECDDQRGRLAASLANRDLIIFDLHTGKQLRKLPTSQSPLTALRFSPSGNSIAAAAKDSTVSLWNLRTGQRLGKPLVHGSPIIDFCFCHSDQILATACGDGRMRVWDAANGELISATAAAGSQPLKINFLRGQRKLVGLHSDGHLATNTFGGDLRTTDELLKSARLASGHRLQHGNLVATSSKELLFLWELTRPRRAAE